MVLEELKGRGKPLTYEVVDKIIQSLYVLILIELAPIKCWKLELILSPQNNFKTK